MRYAEFGREDLKIQNYIPPLFVFFSIEFYGFESLEGPGLYGPCLIDLKNQIIEIHLRMILIYNYRSLLILPRG